MAVHLRRARPGIRLKVIDPTGHWLAGWHEQFARAEIDSLRSPIVHHPGSDPYELTDFISLAGLPRSGLPYDPPTTEAFARFCRSLVADLGLDQPMARRASAVRSDGRSVVVETDDGSIRADHLVLATNPHRRSIPDWVWPLLGGAKERFVFGADVDLRQRTDLDGRRVAIIGGGLTAAHLACGAAARGADVCLATRRPLTVRDFDTDPGWLGPRFLADFIDDDDPESRRRIALAARGGGTIPPWMRSQLDDLEAAGRLRISEGRGPLRGTMDDAGRCVVTGAGRDAVTADEVWLATGTVPHLGAARYLESLAADVPILDGLPITGDNLRLGPHPVYVMGRLAMLALGPAAGNIWGAQRAATRITEQLTGVDLEHRSVVPTLRRRRGRG